MRGGFNPNLFTTTLLIHTVNRGLLMYLMYIYLHWSWSPAEYCVTSVSAQLMQCTTVTDDCCDSLLPDCRPKKDKMSFWLPQCSHVDSSVNHFSTRALFSVTHLMLAVVFSMACSSANVAEPKPTCRLSSLNFFSWKEKKHKEKKMNFCICCVDSSWKYRQGFAVCVSVWLCGLQTSCNSNSVDNLFVTPLTRLEKENDPVPYLKHKEGCSSQ